MNSVKKNWINQNAARFICCLTLYWPNGYSYTSKGIINGKIASEKKAHNGFGYDPIFIPKGSKVTFAQMLSREKFKIDHRSKAFQKIKKFF